MISLGRYAPEWARGICEDLEAGIPGHEAVANAAGALRHQADLVARQALAAEAKVALWERGGSAFICGDTMLRENRERAADHRHYESYLRSTADQVAKLKGEVISVGGWLR